ncbi:hypothetical protein MTR67_019533 [Solanum verrucosum]|uniref:Uncharacterized protein n=1 Tax=Solanum verrucosum TaxID=315347 RepID=A0AAF0QPR8_SOLVR|nr:hypothetical protein MTR67_019533 [Solanum verrucosum]
MTFSVQATSQPVQSTQAASQSISSNQAASHSTSSSQAESQSKPFKKRVVRRESTEYWTIEAIDSEGSKKKLKVKVKKVLNLPGEDRIMVNFDYLDCPFGEAQSLLSGFCGILAVDSSLFSMHFDKWPNIAPIFFEEVFSDPLKSKTQIMDNVSPGIPRDQWTSYVNYRYKKETQMAETDQVPGRAELYLATHRNVNGAYVNKEAKVVCVIYLCSQLLFNISIMCSVCVLYSGKNQQTLSQSTMDESIISPDNAIGKVLGKEHSGRVRCLGLGVVPTKVFKQARPRFNGMNASSVSCPSNCQQNYNKLLNCHNQMMAAFKSYMIMKEGTLPEQFVGLFAPPPTMVNIIFTFSLPK